MFLLPQAACKIAGRNINVAVIQSMVLGCNTHCPGQVRRKCTWLGPNTAKSMVMLVLYWLYVSCMLISSVDPFNAVATDLALPQDQKQSGQSRARVASLCRCTIRASFTLCTLFGEPFWSCGKQQVTEKKRCRRTLNSFQIELIHAYFFSSQYWLMWIYMRFNYWQAFKARIWHEKLHVSYPIMSH
jgi:hypothetical protein